jgi:TrmH family RNA methyltransferase
VPTSPRSKAAQEVITSRENRWLKRFRAALEGPPTKEQPCVGLEGPRLVEEGFRSGVAIEAVLVCEEGERHLARLKAWMTPEVRLLRCSDRLFASVAATETPQGIAALARVREREFSELLGRDAGEKQDAALPKESGQVEGRVGESGKDAALKGSATSGITSGATSGTTGGVPLVIVLAAMQDPGNVGALLRSAAAFGATGAVACHGTAHPFSPKVLRASAGLALRLPVLAGVPAQSALARLREAGLRIYAASLRGTTLPADSDFCGPCALVIGNEAAGLTPELERAADARLRIPLAEGVDSLNAAVAGAVLLYEAARQRSARQAAQRENKSKANA